MINSTNVAIGATRKKTREFSDKGLVVRFIELQPILSKGVHATRATRRVRLKKQAIEYAITLSYCLQTQKGVRRKVLIGQCHFREQQGVHILVTALITGLMIQMWRCPTNSLICSMIGRSISKRLGNVVHTFFSSIV